ncbi:uncharacterized protein LOC144135255 [Amblyomma americanum]
MRWRCALLSVAWLQGVACMKLWRGVADKGPAPTGPPMHAANEDDEYYLEDTGEKEYYYYDQDEYYEYFQDRKPIAGFRNRRLERSLKKLRRTIQAAAVQGCNETQLINVRNMCERKMTLAKKLRRRRPRNKKVRSVQWRKVCRLVTDYSDCISAIAPSRECPDIAFKLKTDALRSVHTEGFQVCRSPSVEPFACLVVAAASTYAQRLLQN